MNFILQNADKGEGVKKSKNIAGIKSGSSLTPLPTCLDAVHLVQRASVLLVVLCVPEVPAEVVEDAEVVAREAVRHEVVVQVAVPRDRQRHHAALDRHP